MWDLKFNPTETTVQVLAGHDAARSYLYMELSNDWTCLSMCAVLLFVIALLIWLWGRPPRTMSGGAKNAT